MTTQHLPDYFPTPEACLRAKRVNTNPKYPHFKQTHFTVGAEFQFHRRRDPTNGTQRTVPVPQDNTYASEQLMLHWSKYQNLTPTAVDHTFRYMFHKLKKGLFVKIKNNQLAVFLPFSKNNFTNEWSHRVYVHPKYGTMQRFAEHINAMGKLPYKVSAQRYTNKWYANNCLVRYEFPIHEGDTNVPIMSDLLKTLCRERKVPDMEFFLNRRDFPVLRTDEKEPYHHIWGDHPLVSHNYEKYAPIVSMVSAPSFGDLASPTCDDWIRVSPGKYFLPKGRQISVDFELDWNAKQPTAVFRGASTGAGVTCSTNPRLKVAHLDATQPLETPPLLDAGITKWQLRPRKLCTQKYLQTIDVPALERKGIRLKPFVSPKDQSRYKYILHIPGHVAAYRLSVELAMGSCILKVDTPYRLWFERLLKPMVHYVPVRADLSDLLDKIRWCRENDAACRTIAENARTFYDTYLCRDGILDYWQKLLIDMKGWTGHYVHPICTPLQRQLSREQGCTLPVHQVPLRDVPIPYEIGRHSLFRAIEKMLEEGKGGFLKSTGTILFKNRTGTVQVHKRRIGPVDVAVKTTTDSDKFNETIHEAFIAQEINRLVKEIPNFVYTLGVIDTSLLYEYVEGETMEAWLNKARSPSEQTSFVYEYMFLLIQIALALDVAQQRIGFVHWDLTPWNIILRPLKTPRVFDYLTHRGIVRVKTSLVPVLIDFGRSHVIHNRQHHGYINMFDIRPFQDIITLVITSLDTITRTPVSSATADALVQIANVLSGTSFRSRPFRRTGRTGTADIRFFTQTERKYEHLLKDKGELGTRSPLALMDHLHKCFGYRFGLGGGQYRLNAYDNGSWRQVYRWLSSATDVERHASFVDAMTHIGSSSPPSTKVEVYRSCQRQWALLRTLKCQWKQLPRLPKNDIREQLKTAYVDAKHRLDCMLERAATTSHASVAVPAIKGASYTESVFTDPKKLYDLLSSQPGGVYRGRWRAAWEEVKVYTGRYEIPPEVFNTVVKRHQQELTSSRLKNVYAYVQYQTLKRVASDVCERTLRDVPLTVLREWAEWYRNCVASKK